MKTLLDIFVRGVPAPMPRHRTAIVFGHTQEYYPEKYPRDDPQGRGGMKLPWLVWREAIERTVNSQHRPAKVEGPIRMDIDFYFPRPERLCKPSSPRGQIRHITKPDGYDNCAKLIGDTLTKCGVWVDDCQVCAGEITKWYHAMGDATGARISICLLEDPAPAMFDDVDVRPTELREREVPAAPVRPAPRSEP